MSCPIHWDVVDQGAAEYSEVTAELIDNEVREIISAQNARVLNILGGKKQFLEKDKIDGEELKTLMAENF